MQKVKAKRKHKQIILALISVWEVVSCVSNEEAIDVELLILFQDDSSLELYI